MQPWNIHLFKRHVNAVRYIVNNMKQNTLQLILANGATTANRVWLPPMPYGPNEASFLIHDVLKAQFSVGVCFGITPNKAQRQSFSGAIGLDLHEHEFSHSTTSHYQELRTQKPLHSFANMSINLKRGLYGGSSKTDVVITNWKRNVFHFIVENVYYDFKKYIYMFTWWLNIAIENSN